MKYHDFANPTIKDVSLVLIGYADDVTFTRYLECKAHKKILVEFFFLYHFFAYSYVIPLTK